MSRLVRALAFVATLLALVVSWPAAARAGEPVGNTPRDVPIVLEPSTVKLPPLPRDMVTVKHDWLTIAYPSTVKERVQPLIDHADEVKATLADLLGQKVLDHVDVRVARSPEDMDDLAPVGHPPPQYAVGVAYSSLHLVLLSLREPRTAEASDIGEVFRHELVHVALEDAVAGHHVPLWFNEGLAVDASGEKSWERLHTLWDATLSKSVIPLDDLDKSFPDENYEVSIAYAESADFVRFLTRDADRARFQSLIERVRNGTRFDRGMEDAYGTDERKLEYEWREELDRRFSIWPVLTGGTLLWVGAAGIMVAAYVKRRRRSKETLAKWEAEEAREEMLARAVVPVEAEATLAPLASANIPTVEHEGRIYTVH